MTNTRGSMVEVIVTFGTVPTPRHDDLLTAENQNEILIIGRFKNELMRIVRTENCNACEFQNRRIYIYYPRVWTCSRCECIRTRERKLLLPIRVNILSYRIRWLYSLLLKSAVTNQLYSRKKKKQLGTHVRSDCFFEVERSILVVRTLRYIERVPRNLSEIM